MFISKIVLSFSFICVYLKKITFINSNGGQYDQLTIMNNLSVKIISSNREMSWFVTDAKRK